MDHVPVSIVIPAFNEAHRLPESLPRLTSVLGRLAGAEVIIVDDGSTDRTAEVAQQLLSGFPRSHVVKLPWNSGKGAAVRTGVAMARGASIVFMDADMASDVNDLPLLLAALQDAEVALGSRRIGGSTVRSNGRRMGSWAFNQITRTFTALDVADTQCGFKAFRHAEAKLLFSLSRSTGFGFDVEVLSLARSMGYRITEVPVRWSEMAGGTFRVSRHTPAMLVDVLRARRYHRRRAAVTSAPLGLRPVEAQPSVVLQPVPTPLAVVRRPSVSTAPAATDDTQPSQAPVARVISMGTGALVAGGAPAEMPTSPAILPAGRDASRLPANREGRQPAPREVV
ncbi:MULTISPECIES: dolichyl-phosphate beta-glucosyltransferase [Protofrankia]|uniref:dolichyl-phosphate beta-glucosyltransferase n=1 Tax=Protofrankia coriariae TaxID=1562887 RepID=A0ABR5F471_9ACTN|nr:MULTISPECIES: dolichyl-phosphate beta-glucosyltransferase [Protofrankia]KLL11526.1 glycosyl transferase [Protofrankia coriariae]ONH35655.1 glycosyl transferase [Protofrankia sp. BMG5.30]